MDYKYGAYELRPYQAECYEAIAQHLRTLNRFQEQDKNKLIGAIFEASVGAGKTSVMGAVCARFVEMKWPVLCLARDLKLVEQNAATFWDMEVPNSIYSASYMKAMHYKDSGVIVSNEATAYNAIMSGAWAEYTPRAIVVDECHQVGIEREDSQYMQILTELNHKCVRKHGHRIVLLGGTGSAYRHVNTIIGDMWRESLYNIDTASLVAMGYLVPTIFGADVGHDKELDFDLSEFESKSENGTSDFSTAEMARMEEKILSSKDKLQKVCDEIVELAKDRNAVMITASGVKHCKEVQKLLPQNSAVIVTSKNSKADNDAAIARIESGDAKYLLQIGCLTTGFDCPVIDTSVILRRIGSLTLLVQLLGRGMRLLKPEHERRGLSKPNHLVLDYSGTMDAMGELYENPILEECKLHEDKSTEKDTQYCPVCSAENSLTANQCIGIGNDGKRCEHFFQFVLCVDKIAPNGVVLEKGCGAKNSKKSRTCRCCNKWLNDPNENLNGQHYTKNDLIDVKSFSFGITKAGDKVLAVYKLANGVTAKEMFNIQSREKWVRGAWSKFINDHVVSEITKKKMLGLRTPKKALEYVGEVRAPKRVTHRRNDRNFDLIARKEFE